MHRKGEERDNDGRRGVGRGSKERYGNGKERVKGERAGRKLEERKRG